MRLRFTRTNGPVDETIERLIAQAGEVKYPELIREMIIAALLAGQEDEEKADLKLMNTTMKEMRFTAKIFGPYRGVRKVTVFGSARTEPGHPAYEMARQFGRRLAENGYMIITGGGGGIMQAANEGAGPEHSFGVNIQLPFEQKANYVLEHSPRLITYKYFFNRKVAFVKEADAIALFPGGFGTLDEAMEVLTLVQTGKHSPLPLVLIDTPDGTYWKNWLRFFREELLARRYVSQTDFSIFRPVHSVDEALEHISRFYRRYHSLRYANGKLVIRLTSDLEPGAVDGMVRDFGDILLPGGGMRLSGPLPEEAGETGLAHLPRLVVDFNQKDFGRLRELINAVNA